MSKNLIEKIVEETIRRHYLFSQGSRILAACSGGADSVCLLHILNGLKQDWGLELAVIHYNHGLRSEAGKDQSFVENLAGSLGFVCYTEKGDVKSYARARGLCLEEAGRDLRYEFFRRTAEIYGAAAVATGHTRGDQVETVLMRLMRGSGRGGITGIPPFAGNLIVRPLLDIGRREVEAYLQERDTPFRSDYSNLDRRFLRNRIRLELVPQLREIFGKGFEDRVSRWAEIIREEETWIDSLVEEESKDLLLEQSGEWILDLERVGTLPPALQRRILRVYIQKLRGNLRDLSFADVDSLLRLKRGKSLQLKRDFLLTNQRGLLRPWSTVKTADFRFEWDGRGRIEISESGRKFAGKTFLYKGRLPKFNDSAVAVFDYEKLSFPILIRPRRPGDRYRPFGSPGRKKLKELLRAKEIPVTERGLLPVFLSGDQIIWVPGLPAAEDFKVTASTRTVFRITCKTG